MDRLIDADALEDRFGISDWGLWAKEEVRDAPTVDAVPVVRCKDCKHFVADTKVGGKWISVKDRLPEHGDVVLCFMKFGEHRILQWDNVSSWWLGYGQGDDWQKSDVTHWAKMPQPPKGE